MFIELHIIQNFAPSNLNRDDTNNPKDCEFGGVRRARISSQCIKRAIRLSPVFAQITAVPPSLRTRWLTRNLVETLQKAGKPEEQARQVANSFANSLSGKMDQKETERTSVLLFVSPAEIQTIANHLLANWPALSNVSSENEREKFFKDLVKDFLKQLHRRTGAPDIALFGRMLADKPEVNLEAACQVAHAISTHRVTMEMDFFTAVDDLQQATETGAGMIGFTGFNSACFYRYACLDWEQLVKNLDHDVALARRTVEGFLLAAITAVPTGKQNSFAAQNPPSFILGVVRKNGVPLSLANAFEKPVRPGRDTGLLGNSVVALDAYWARLVEVYGSSAIVGLAALVLEPDLEIEHLKPSLQKDLSSWSNVILNKLPGE